jgi:YhhN family
VWTLIFFVLAGVALLTQTARARSVSYVLRGPVKAAPAFFLAGVSWYLNGPPLLTLAFFLCACGDILLDMAKANFTWAFEAGVVVFAAALICLSFVYLSKPLAGYPLLPLSLPNIVLALFACVWVLPKIKPSLRILGVGYLCLLVASNVIASTSLVPVFLGSTLWLLSDLAIAIGRFIPGTPAHGLTNLGLYDLGLYFIAVGFLR